MNSNRDKSVTLEEQVAQMEQSLETLRRLIDRQKARTAQDEDSKPTDPSDVCMAAADRVLEVIGATCIDHRHLDPIAVTMTVMTLAVGRCMLAALAGSDIPRDVMVRRHVKSVVEFLNDFDAENGSVH